MKDIFTIIFRLTLSCLLAGTVMGTTFVLTNKAKKHNEHVKEERVAYSLLGFEGEAPEAVAINTVHRYVLAQAGEQYIGYLLPAGSEAAEPYVFLQIDLDGNLTQSYPVPLTPEKAAEPAERETAVLAAVGPGKEIRYAEKYQFITDGDERTGYLVTGKFPGFKTHIAVMLALQPDFSIIGFEVLEHEEDPGLGAEIEQEFFKNQFAGKPFSVLKDLDVVKEPVPDEYMEALQMELPPEELEKVMEKYRGNDIYALTGATISTVAVADGIKAMVKKFAYRVNILDSVIDRQNVSVSI